jgi:DNA-binding beta-propeller fold protein YncE
LASPPGPSPQPGTFNSPGGIAVDREGALYVADTRNARIQKLKQ